MTTNRPYDVALDCRAPRVRHRWSLYGVLCCAAALSAGCDVRVGETVFVYPWALIALASLPLIAWWMRVHRGASMNFSRGHDLAQGAVPLRARVRGVPHLLRLVSIALIVIACARPQSETVEARTVEGIDIMIALDLSGSMMAVDMHPNDIERIQITENREPDNRFDIAVSTLKDFVRGREHDRIGMVVFARDAYLQFPLTLDYATILRLLDELELHMIDASATAIGNAIGVSLRALLESEARSRTIILITDGKQQGGNISPIHATELAAEEGVIVYPILVGTEGMSYVPTQRRIPGRGMQYRQQSYPVDPELLATIAEMTGGQSYSSENAEELERDLNAILDDLERTRVQDVSNVRRHDIFDHFLYAALILLLIEALLAHLIIRRLP